MTKNKTVSNFLNTALFFSVSVSIFLAALFKPLSSQNFPSEFLFFILLTIFLCVLKFTPLIENTLARKNQNIICKTKKENDEEEEALDSRAYIHQSILIIRLFLYFSIAMVTLNYIFNARLQHISLSQFVLIGIILLSTIYLSRQRKAIKTFDRILTNLLGIMSFAIIIITIIEFSTRALIAINILPDIPHTYEINADFPKHIPDDLPEFISNDFQNCTLTVSISQETGMIVSNDIDTLTCKVENGVRHTTDQPEDYEHTIYMLGGSTLFSNNGSDYFTIPSYIQRYLNEDYGSTYRVVNLGVPGYNVKQQNFILKQTPLKKGDIVIYYDGVNNIFGQSKFHMYQQLFLNDDFNLDTARKNQNLLKTLAIQTRNWLSNHSLEFLRTAGDYSEFIHLLRTFNWEALKKPLEDQDWQATQINNSVSLYHKEIIEGYNYSIEHGAKFFHYIQPSLFSLNKYTDHEQLLLETFGKDYTFRKCQKAFVDNNNALTDLGIHSVDLTWVLNSENRTTEDEIFFDHWHINYLGRELVAQALYKDLKQYLAP